MIGSVFHPQITHLTCVIYGLHRICEQIQGLYPNVDRLIANITKEFFKSPSIVQILKNIVQQP